MSGFRFLQQHRTWEDGSAVLLGVADRGIAVVSVLSHDDGRRTQHHDPQHVVVGMLVFGLAQLEYVALQRWEEVGEIALGLWLIASPFILGYAGTTCFAPGTSLSAQSSSCWVRFSSGRIGAQRPGPGQPSAVIAGGPAGCTRDRRAFELEALVLQ